jgi:hypothetical protein
MPTMPDSFNDYFSALDQSFYDMPLSPSNDWTLSTDDMDTIYSNLTADSTFTIPQMSWDQQISEFYVDENTEPIEPTTTGSTSASSSLPEPISSTTSIPQLPNLDFMANADESSWAPQGSSSPGFIPSSPDMDTPQRKPTKRRSIHKVRQDHCFVEQKYRSGLKDAIHTLHGAVPHLQVNATKVGVLLAAASHIKELKEECKQLNAKNRWLMTHVRQDALLLKMIA